MFQSLHFVKRTVSFYVAAWSVMTGFTPPAVALDTVIENEVENVAVAVKQQSLELTASSAVNISGQQRFKDHILEFSGTVNPEDSSMYVIDLRIGDQQWATTITIGPDDRASLTVVSAGVVITDVNKSHLLFTAEQLNAHAYDTQNDTLLMRLLTQMISYWSRSPSGFEIKSGKLGD